MKEFDIQLNRDEQGYYLTGKDVPPEYDDWRMEDNIQALEEIKRLLNDLKKAKMLELGQRPRYVNGVPMYNYPLSLP